MSDIDLLVECEHCGAPPHKPCAEDDGIGGWFDVPSHQARLVDAQCAERDRLAADNESLRREVERLRESVMHWRNWSDDVAAPWGLARDRSDAGQRTAIGERFNALISDRDALRATVERMAARLDAAIAACREVVTRGNVIHDRLHEQKLLVGEGIHDFLHYCIGASMDGWNSGPRSVIGNNAIDAAEQGESK